MLAKNPKVPDAVLQQLLCISCKSYLSCSPLRVLPDGTTQCGRCVTSDGHRGIAFEVILNIFIFPCVFQQRGCKHWLKFNEAIEHESQCPYRSLPCPLVSNTLCTWSGPVSDFIDHFKEAHCGFIWKDCAFKLDVNKTSRDVFVCLKNNTAFFVSYTYNSEKKVLEYAVCYCSNKAIAAGYKPRILNEEDHDCSINLKLRKCNQYLRNEETATLNLNDYLKNLDDPSVVAVILELQVKEDHTTAISYNVLNSLKCGDCCNFLIPPIYDLDERIICSDCGRHNPHCVPSNHQSIKKLVADASYPCRWRECNDIVKSDQFRNHELNCQFRYYDCFFPTCKVSFKLESAIEHLQSHRSVYMTHGISYKLKFNQDYAFKHLFAIKNNIITVVQHSVIQIDDKSVHRIALFSSNPNYVTGNVDFEHEHCKLKSKLFLLVSDHNTDVCISQLPPCFKATDELLATVTLLDDKIVPTLKDVAVPALNTDKNV